MYLCISKMKITIVAFTLGLLLAALHPVAAQEKFHYKPRTERVAHLPEEVEGTSSLFWMDGRLWTANDHGSLKLYSLDTLTAAIDSVIDLGVTVYDLEEVTLDSNYLFFGDFGDNRGSRSDLRILRLSRSNLAAGRFLFDTILFYYPERTVALARDFDCEAFVAGADSLYLFTKQWSSQNSDCYALPKVPGNYAAEHRFMLPAAGLLTGACYLPERRMLVLLGYSKLVKPFIYVIDGFEGEDFSSGRHRRSSLANPIGTQTEGVATLDGRHLFLTHETLRLRLFYRRASLLHLDLPEMPEESPVAN